MANPLRSPDEIISALGAFPDDLSRSLSSVPDPDDLARPATDGGWGVVEILPHLRDWEEIYFDRVGKVIQEDEPYLPSYDDTLWSIERDYRSQDPAEALEAFKRTRMRMIELMRSLPASAWSRKAEHGHFGSITLQWLANYIVDHDQEHWQQIRDALAA